MAKANVPNATLLVGDVTQVDFPEESFDAVAAFYSIIHVPCEEQPRLLGNIAGWLKPGGWLVATMGVGPAEDIRQEDWLGVPMFWSHFDLETNVRLMEEAGLTLESQQVRSVEELGKKVPFLWIVARKPPKD